MVATKVSAGAIALPGPTGADGASDDDDEGQPTDRLLHGGEARGRARAGTDASRASSAGSVVFADLKHAGGAVQKRQLFGLMSFIGLANVYAMRVNLSEASEPMQDHFGWTNKQQGYVLSSFFWGYVCFQIPGALMAERWGGKIVFGYGVLATAALTLLLPFVAKKLWAVYLIRAVMGFAEGVTFPALNTLFTHWVPCTERAWLVGAINAGPYFGNAFALPISGILIGIHKDTSGSSSADSDCGWPSYTPCTWPWVFYFFGILGLLWFPAWMWVVSSTPREHPTISPGELKYIEATTKEDAERNAEKKIAVVKSEKVPWVAFLTHPAALTLYINHFASNYCVFTVMTYLPKYLKEDLDFDIKSAGIISALPFILQCLGSIGSGRISECMAHHMPVRRVRLIAELTSFVGAGSFLVLTGFCENNRTLAVAMVTIATGFTGVSSAGYNTNFMDISPYYAGRMYGISNTIANIAGIIAPIVGGAILGDSSPEMLSPADGGGEAPQAPSNDRWRHIFMLTAAVYTVASLLWIVGMRAKPVQALN